MPRPAIPAPTARRDRGLPRPSRGAARPATPRAAGARPAPRRCWPGSTAAASARRPTSTPPQNSSSASPSNAAQAPQGEARSAGAQGQKREACARCRRAVHGQRGYHVARTGVQRAAPPAPHCLHAAAAGAERHRRLRGHAARRAGRALRLRSGLRRLAGGGAARRGGGRPGARAPAHRPAGASCTSSATTLAMASCSRRCATCRASRPCTTLASCICARQRAPRRRTCAPACATCRRPSPATRARSPARRGGAVPTTSSSTWRARSWRARAPWSFIPGSRGTGCAPCTASARRRMWRSSRTSCPRSPCPRADEARARLGIPPDAFLVCTAGFATAAKRFDWLIGALDLAVEKGAAIHWIHAGAERPEEFPLAAAIAERPALREPRADRRLPLGSGAHRPRGRGRRAGEPALPVGGREFRLPRARLRGRCLLRRVRHRRLCRVAARRGAAHPARRSRAGAGGSAGRARRRPGPRGGHRRGGAAIRHGRDGAARRRPAIPRADRGLARPAPWRPAALRRSGRSRPSPSRSGRISPPRPSHGRCARSKARAACCSQRRISRPWPTSACTARHCSTHCCRPGPHLRAMRVLEEPRAGLLVDLDCGRGG